MSPKPEMIEELEIVELGTATDETKEPGPALADGSGEPTGNQVL